MNKSINKRGIYAGLAMALIMSALSTTGNYEIGPVKYLQYFVLIGFFIKTALDIKDEVAANTFFQKAMTAGFRMSILAGVVLALATLVLYAINPIFAPMKFNLLPQDLFQAMTIAVILLFETVAFGVIVNFAIIQALKPGAETVNQ